MLAADRAPLATPHPNMNSDNTGFSHGAYVSGLGDRNRRPNLPSISTATVNQNHDVPGNFDVGFTPLLPSQLLLGSPFQPGTPPAFAPSQFGMPSFTTTPGSPPNVQGALASPTQPLPPQLYQSVIPPDMNGASIMAGAQPPVAGFTGFANAAFGTANPTLQVNGGLLTGASRTVYLGNLPPETPAEEILGHVRSGQIESVRLLPDKNCAFISFLDSSSATHFHSDAILKKLTIKGNDIKIGWGKASQVPTSVTLAVQQSGASRNVYLGNLSDDVTEEELCEDLGKFGPIDTVKIVREKNIAFVHFLSISNAIKAVSQLPQEPKWQAPKRVYYGKDRCAYVSKTQQQNAAQYLGIAPGYANALNAADRDLISNALAQQSVAAAAVATTAGGVNNLGNRTVYLGNIHPETSIEEICNVVRGGLLHHIRYIPDKHICFVTFVDPTAAASFYALSNLQGLMIHNRRLKVGWGKHSGALPPAIALAVSGGASRNVYIGNLDESWSEDRLRQDFSAYGEIELVNTLREKSCAFVNFTNIANAIKAIEGMRGREEYKRFKINFGKDRCGNPPRQVNGNQQRSDAGPPSPVPNGSFQPAAGSGSSPNRQQFSPAPPSAESHNGKPHTVLPPTPSTILNAGDNNPLTMFLSQMSQHPVEEPEPGLDEINLATLPQQQQTLAPPQPPTLYSPPSNELANGGASLPTSLHQSKGSVNALMNGSSANGESAMTSNTLAVPRSTAHSRAISLPSFSQEPFGHSLSSHSHHQPRQSIAHQAQSSFSGFGSGLGGLGHNGYGLSIQNEGSMSGWADDQLRAN